MKKVLIIVGSPHRGKTFHILSAFEKKATALEAMKFEYIHLAKSELALCKSCNLCFTTGEGSCPSRDDALKIFKKMLTADAIVFAAPVFSLQVPAVMKNLLDRLAFVFHRPALFGKTAMVVTTQGIYGDKQVHRYLSTVAHMWGCNIVKGIAVTPPFTEPTPEETAALDKAINSGARRFVRALSRNQYPVPPLMELMMFRFRRGFSRYTAHIFPADSRYFEQQGWLDSGYYYPVRLGLFRSLFGKLIDGSARRRGRKLQRQAAPNNR